MVIEPEYVVQEAIADASALAEIVVVASVLHWPSRSTVSCTSKHHYVLGLGIVDASSWEWQWCGNVVVTYRAQSWRTLQLVGGTLRSPLLLFA